MEWGGATIGWAASSSIYEKHSLSGSSSASIGCRYSSSHSAVLYKLSEGEREREKERERKQERERGREKEGERVEESLCVCVCVLGNQERKEKYLRSHV